MNAELRAAYRSMAPIIVEDIARLMTLTQDQGQRAGIGFVLAHVIKSRSRDVPRKKDPKED